MDKEKKSERQKGRERQKDRQTEIQIDRTNEDLKKSEEKNTDKDVKKRD